MTVLSWSRCRNRSYSVFWSLLLITSAMSIKRLMSRCVITWPDVITNAKPNCQAHTWNAYPLTPQPIPFNLQPFAPKFSLRRKKKSFKSPVKFFRGHGEFCGKATWPHAQSKGNVTQKLFANMCTVGDPGKGPGGPPPYFLTKLRPEGRKKFFLETGSPPPPFISGSGWPGYTVVPKTFLRLISTKVGDVHHCPRRRGLRKRFLYLRIIDVENKWLLTLCYNVLICRRFIVLSLATDIVSKDLRYLQNRFQEPTVEPETRCAGHGELVLWSQNWQGKLLGVLCRTKRGYVWMLLGGRLRALSVIIVNLTVFALTVYCCLHWRSFDPSPDFRCYKN